MIRYERRVSLERHLDSGCQTRLVSKTIHILQFGHLGGGIDGWETVASDFLNFLIVGSLELHFGWKGAVTELSIVIVVGQSDIRSAIAATLPFHIVNERSSKRDGCVGCSRHIKFSRTQSLIGTNIHIANIPRRCQVVVSICKTIFQQADFTACNIIAAGNQCHQKGGFPIRASLFALTATLLAPITLLASTALLAPTALVVTTIRLFTLALLESSSPRALSTQDVILLCCHKDAKYG